MNFLQWNPIQFIIKSRILLIIIKITVSEKKNRISNDVAWNPVGIHCFVTETEKKMKINMKFYRNDFAQTAVKLIQF